MSLSWPDGTMYFSSDHHNETSFECPDEWGTQPGTGITNIVDWDELTGGTGASGAYSSDPYFPPYNYQDAWGGGRWPEFGQGMQTSIPDGSTNIAYAPESTSVISGAMPYGYLSFVSTRFIPWWGTNDNINIQYNDQRELTLLTGGDPTSSDDEFYLISGSAKSINFLDFPVFDPYNPAHVVWTTIPPQQISISGFGSLDSNGNLYVLLPKHKSPVITPHINSSKYSLINIQAQGYPIIPQCVATTPANQTRTDLGVGEQVNLSVNLSAYYTNFIWSTSSGSLSSINGNSTQFTAPSNAATVMVTVKVFGKPESIKFNVHEPSGWCHSKMLSTNYYAPGVVGAGMTNLIWIAPTNVSFYRVNMMEVGLDGTNISGYFSQFTPGQLHHSTADLWIPLNPANRFRDGAYITTSNTSYSSGGFSWNIPARWQVIGSGVTNSMNGWNQIFSMDASATVTVHKFNLSITRTTNGVSTAQ